jgi:hypothetical protein
MVTVNKGRVDKRYGLVKALLVCITYMKERQIPIVEEEFRRGYDTINPINEMIKKAMFGL